MPVLKVYAGEQQSEIEVRAGDGLLDALLVAGKRVSYSCRRGDCGQCVCALVKGDVASLDPQRPLYLGDDVLLCNAKAVTNATLSLPYFPELDGIEVLKSPVKIHEIRPLAQMVREVVLRLPPSQYFNFLPGQFMRVTNRFQVTRTYSFAAPPGDDRLLRFHVSYVPGGAFSRYVFDEAKENDLLYIEGPSGDFFLRDRDVARKTVFLATGTGIAPVLAILSGMSEERRRVLGSIYVYWGVREHADAYASGELVRLSKAIGFEYTAVFSRETNGSVRYVQQVLAAEHGDLSEALVFASGNPAMIEAARGGCAGLGLPEYAFRSDSFTAS